MDFNLKKLEPILVEIHEEKYPTRMTNRAVKELEEMWGIKYFALFDKIAGAGLEINEMIDVIYVTLKGGGVKVEREQLEDIEITAQFITHANDTIIKLFDNSQRIESILEDDKESDEEKNAKKN